MLFNTIKFNKEIRVLRKLAATETLHPLKREQIKREIFARLGARQEPAAPKLSWAARGHKIIRYVISFLVGLSLLGGTALAANSAKPGDFLFPVKKATEQIQLSLIVNEEAKIRLQTKIAEKRLHELEEISAEAGASVKNSGGDGGFAATGAATTVLPRPDWDKAEDRAKSEVKNAVTTLTDVRIKLEAKGNTEAAAAIGQTINRLKDKLETEAPEKRKGFEESRATVDPEQKGRGETVGATATATIPALPPVRGERPRNEPAEEQNDAPNSRSDIKFDSTNQDNPSSILRRGRD